MQIVFSKKTKIQELRTESSHGKGCLILRTYFYGAKKQEGNIKHLKIQNLNNIVNMIWQYFGGPD